MTVINLPIQEINVEVYQNDSFSRFKIKFIDSAGSSADVSKETKNESAQHAEMAALNNLQNIYLTLEPIAESLLADNIFRTLRISQTINITGEKREITFRATAEIPIGREPASVVWSASSIVGLGQTLTVFIDQVKKIISNLQP